VESRRTFSPRTENRLFLSLVLSLKYTQYLGKFNSFQYGVSLTFIYLYFESLMRSLFFITSLFVLSALVQAKPNVVFILSDDQGWDDYGFMGSNQVNTPHLDQLAAESLLFKRGYVTSPLCRPSLASMVTGLHTHQHQVTGNDVDGRNNRAELDKPVRAFFHQQPSFIKALVADGYLAHQSGKWWEGSWQDGGFTAGMTRGDRHGDKGLVIGRKGMKPVTDFIDNAVENEKPFCVWYAPFLPHTPHNPPKRLIEKNSKAGRAMDVVKYYAMIEWFDETCGELLGHLKKKNLEQDTLVVYMCDNGWKAKSQSEIELPNAWTFSYAPKSKGSPYEYGIRTPIMFKWPSKISPVSSPALASGVDLYTTILSQCGVNYPDTMPGINLVDEKARAARKSVFGVSYAIHNMTVENPVDTKQYRWLIHENWKYLVRDHGVDTTKYKYVHEWDTTPEHLYDLSRDPGEKVNLVSSQPELTSKLRQKLQNFLK